MTEALRSTPGESPAPSRAEVWRDPDRPVAERVADLMARMTLEEKAGQLVGYWARPAEPGEPVSPMEDDSGEPAPAMEEIAKAGLGQLTRVFGTAPVAPAEGVARLRELQLLVARANRFGIPAIAHEECLTGLMTWRATVFPTPLAWGATFDAELAGRMGAAIGATMRRVGLHQGLAPVLDVVRDYRWGRNEECLGEDPNLVGVLGAAYVRGLEGAGIVATLKHLAGYASSRGGRNMAPVPVGPRELADVVLEPFVIALREGGARSVMPSYTDTDGVPASSDPKLLTEFLRDELGFTGLVVSDYYAISFLQSRHRVSGSRGASAAQALRAGMDVELPTVRCYGEPLLEEVRSGALPEEDLDRSVARVLAVKAELGLLDESWTAELDEAAATVTADDAFDPPEHRELARRVAEESIVLLENDGTLPLSGRGRVALTGPLAVDAFAMLGCYTFPRHVGVQHPDVPLGIRIPSFADALRAELPDTDLRVAAGQDVYVERDADIEAAVAVARESDVCLLTVGDQAGILYRGTSGEGRDAESLALPGRQAELAAAVMDTGTPTVLVVLSGRPYALGGLAGRAAAVVQAFFPGQEGGPALARVLTGKAEPGGRLPVGVPRHEAGGPGTYLRSKMDGAHDWSTIDPTPHYPFGHGLSWTEFSYAELEVDPSARTDGAVRVSMTITNAGRREGSDVVQLYLSDPEASVVRPLRWLAGWAKVRLRPGESARVTFTVHADRTSFTGPDLRRIVEPGVIEVAVGRSSEDLPLRGEFTLTGPVRVLGADRVLTVPVEITNV
ncbi:beta-glucosidase [Actinomadura welshii]